MQEHSILHILGMAESLKFTVSCSAKVECDLEAEHIMRGLLSSNPSPSHTDLPLPSVPESPPEGPCLPFFGQWQRPGAERDSCVVTQQVSSPTALAQQVGAASLAQLSFTQPGRDFIHPWWRHSPAGGPAWCLMADSLGVPSLLTHCSGLHWAQEL